MKYDKIMKSWDWPLQPKDGLVTLVNDNNRFAADLEMPMFKADEVDVQVINDGIMIRCRNEGDNLRMKRRIERSYQLPRDVDKKSIKTTLKSNGLLQITATKQRRF